MSTGKNSIAFFLEGRNVPASRFRVEQYQELLERDQIPYKNYFTSPSKYLWCPKALRPTPLALPILLAGLSKVVATRVLQIVTASACHQTFFLQRDLLYRIPQPFLEQLLFSVASRNRHARFIFDFDDAIVVDKTGKVSEGLERKLKLIGKHCDVIIAGNDSLASTSPYPEKTLVIPTTVPLERFGRIKKTAASAGRPIIGWTGLAANLHYLQAMEPVFNSLAQNFDFELKILCESGTTPPFLRPAFPVSMIGWTPENEIGTLHEFDIGLMPLRDDAWSRGKCGFKLLQYMAAGLPALASPVGVNREIVEDGVSGYLVNNDEQWREALGTLLGSPEKRLAVGAAARETIEKRYSRKVWYPKWREVVIGEVNTGGSE